MVREKCVHWQICMQRAAGSGPPRQEWSCCLKRTGREECASAIAHPGVVRDDVMSHNADHHFPIIVASAAAAGLAAAAVVWYLWQVGGVIPSPQGIRPVHFWLVLAVVEVIGGIVGYRGPSRWWLVVPVGTMILFGHRVVFSRLFWMDVGGAPVAALLWWIGAFIMGAGFGHYAYARARRRGASSGR